MWAYNSRVLLGMLIAFIVLVQFRPSRRRKCCLI